MNETEASVCSGHGGCIGNDECDCNQDNLLGFWGGAQCESCDSGYGSANCTQAIVTEDSLGGNGDKASSDLLYLLFLLVLIPVGAAVVVGIAVPVYFMVTKGAVAGPAGTV